MADHADTDMREKEQDGNSPYKPIGPYFKFQGTNIQNRQPHITLTNPDTQHLDQPTLDSSLKAQLQSAYTQSSEDINPLPGQHPKSNHVHSTPSSMAQVLNGLNQTTKLTAYNKNGVTTTAPMEAYQNWSHPTSTKVSHSNNTELVETLKKNTSKAPMRTTNHNAR